MRLPQSTRDGNGNYVEVAKAKLPPLEAAFKAKKLAAKAAVDKKAARGRADTVADDTLFPILGDKKKLQGGAGTVADESSTPTLGEKKLQDGAGIAADESLTPTLGEKVRQKTGTAGTKRVSGGSSGSNCLVGQAL